MCLILISELRNQSRMLYVFLNSFMQRIKAFVLHYSFAAESWSAGSKRKRYSFRQSSSNVISCKWIPNAMCQVWWLSHSIFSKMTCYQQWEKFCWYNTYWFVVCNLVYWIGVMIHWINTIFCVSVPYQSCDSAPCQNGGTCVSANVDVFICMCRDGYFGVTCEQSEYAQLIPTPKVLK